MKIKKVISVMLALVMSLSLFVACGEKADKPATDSLNSSGQVASEKTSLTVGVSTDVGKFSPYYTMTFADIFLVYQIYERLVYYKDGEVTPGLAEKWSVSDDKKTLVFTIREGATFHNGEPVTAQDVVFSFETNFERPSAAAVKSKFESVTAKSDREVELKLVYPMESIYSTLASPAMGIISKKYVQEKGDNAWMEPVGSGAFMLKQWNKGSSINLVAYDKYNGEKSNLKELNFDIIADQNTALVALQTGDIDLLVNASAQNAMLAQQDKNLEILQGPSHTSAKIMLNTRTGPTADENLRQAIAYAINRETINAVAYENNGQVSTGMFPDFLFYSGKDFTFKHDVEKAKELMSKTKWAKDGLTLTIKTSTSYGTVVPQLIQSDLAAINITLKVEPLEGNAHSQDYLNGSYELWYSANSSIIPDVGEALWNTYHSPENATKYETTESPEISKLLDEARAELDTAKKTAIYDTILEKVRDMAGYQELVVAPSNIVYKKGLKNTYIDPNGMYYCFKDFSW